MYPSPPMPRSEERASGRRPPIYRYRKIDEREDDGGGAARGAFIVVVARKEDTDGEAEATFPLLGDGSEIVFTPGSCTALPSVSPNLGFCLKMDHQNDTIVMPRAVKFSHMLTEIC